MLLVSWTAVFLIFSFRLRQGACCPNQKERGPVARSNLIPAETSEIFPSLGKSDIAAAHRAALRHLGNTPRGYGGQGRKQRERRRQNHFTRITLINTNFFTTDGHGWTWMNTDLNRKHR